MGYLGVAALMVALAATWNSAHDRTTPTAQTHRLVQKELSQFISGYVAEKMPQSSPVEFRSMWTETLPNGKIKAHFSYRFGTTGDHEPVNMDLKGVAVLTEDATATGSTSRWALDHVSVENEAVVFKEGSRIEGSRASASQLPVEQPDKKTE
jgi:hypothetical protein